jgi:hypothetical protein
MPNHFLGNRNKEAPITVNQHPCQGIPNCFPAVQQMPATPRATINTHLKRIAKKATTANPTALRQIAKKLKEI